MPNLPSLSISLPSSFHLRPPHHHSPFFNPHPEDDDPSRCPAPSVNSASARTRLEVLKGWEVSFSVLSLYLASALACLYVIITVHTTAHSWLASRTIPSLSPFDTIVRVTLEAASVALPVYYFLNLILIPRLTHEQVWTSVLLTVGLLATNPLTRDDLTLVRPRYLVMTDSIYTATIYLYLLLAVHSYRILDYEYLRRFSFYLPKLVIALSYALFKLIAGLSANISLGLIPFARVVTWLRLISSHESSLNITTSVLLTTCMDSAFAFYLVGQVSHTADFLGTVPYVENRAKQLGFRCFVYQTLAFCVSIIALSIVTAILVPSSYLIFLTHNSKHITVLEPPVARLALAFIYFTWTLVLAYVNLPPTPLLHRALYNFSSRFLHRVRNSPIALWLGLADVVNTADAEDSSDEVEISPRRQSVRQNRRRHTVAYAANPLQLPSIQMRYRHHELFDTVLAPSRPLQTLRGARTSATIACMDPLVSSHNDASNVSDLTRLSIQRICSLPSHRASSNSVSHSTTCRRLRLRKNLFVMETQVLMVNVAYLAYIFGNPREELPPPCSRRHEENIRDVPVFQFHDDEEARQGITSADQSNDSGVEEEEREQDDGTMFRVNPYALAERYGYKVHKYVTCTSLNTHAIVLVDSTRVIVSFSGTRDMSNWKVNANVNRVLLDERLTRFEYDVSDTQSIDDDGFDADTTFDALLQNDSQYGLIFDTENAYDSNYSEHSGTSIRRSRSEFDIASQNASGHHVPLSAFNVKSYGTMRANAVRRTQSVYSSRDQPHASPSNSQSIRGSHLASAAVGWQVSVMASTFAHELATFGKAKVHVGFLDAYMSVRKRVLGALVELYGGRGGKGPAASLPLFFTGHSLGGAMAIFGCYEAARYYKRIGIAKRQDISCTTFGCPRVGNEAFKMRYERLVETHWRFEMAADPIPNMSTVVLNYVPVGVQVLIDQSGMLLIDPSFIEVQWWGRLANPYLGYKLHIRASYCMALRTYCKLYKNGMDDLADRFWPFPLRVQTRGFFRQLQFDNAAEDNSELGTP